MRGVPSGWGSAWRVRRYNHAPTAAAMTATTNIKTAKVRTTSFGHRRGFFSRGTVPMVGRWGKFPEPFLPGGVRDSTRIPEAGQQSRSSPA